MHRRPPKPRRPTSLISGDPVRGAMHPSDPDRSWSGRSAPIDTIPFPYFTQIQMLSSICSHRRYGHCYGKCFGLPRFFEWPGRLPASVPNSSALAPPGQPPERLRRSDPSCRLRGRRGPRARKHAPARPGGRAAPRGGSRGRRARGSRPLRFRSELIVDDRRRVRGEPAAGLTVPGREPEVRSDQVAPPFGPEGLLREGRRAAAEKGTGRALKVAVDLRSIRSGATCSAA